MKIRVADYIARTLADRGVGHVFMVTGGGAMHLNDAFGREKRFEVVCCHHEQACAMAAESYFRVTRRLAAVNVTTGPGGTNAVTGIYGAYVDSLGVIVVSGQVKRETLISATKLPLRQLGDQEVDIVAMVRPITKYAVLVNDPASIRYHLEKAVHLATSGRPGPVWLDVPIDVQATLVEPNELRSYDPAEDRIEFETRDLPAAVREVLARVRRAERPVILAGAGVRLSGAHAEFIRLIERLGVPVTTGWNAHDALWNAHPQYAGRPGSVGDRAGNFTVQNADFLLVLGSRLNIRQISYNWKAFARAAKIAMVDVDAAELHKPTLSIDLPIHADLSEFLRLALETPYEGPTPAHARWMDWCLQRRARYPVLLPEHRAVRDSVNPYLFVDELFRRLPAGRAVVTGDGTACVVSFQGADLKPGQRLYTNSGSAPMGYDLPGAIGASFALGRAEVICLAGDGSIQMNLQELQTIATHRLPIKVFVLNNQGYHSIRQTQRNYFPDNVVGCGTESGLGFPDMAKIAEAYGFAFRRIRTPDDLDAGLAATLGAPGFAMCEVILDLNQAFSPKLSSRKLPDGRMVSSPLEDLAPFLPREEFRENMIIPILDEDPS
jgi:acetolactate synthase-1/2/3 large subunit